MRELLIRFKGDADKAASFMSRYFSTVVPSNLDSYDAKQLLIGEPVYADQATDLQRLINQVYNKVSAEAAADLQGMLDQRFKRADIAKKANLALARKEAGLPYNPHIDPNSDDPDILFTPSAGSAVPPERFAEPAYQAKMKQIYEVLQKLKPSFPDVYTKMMPVYTQGGMTPEELLAKLERELDDANAPADTTAEQGKIGGADRPLRLPDAEFEPMNTTVTNPLPSAPPLPMPILPTAPPWPEAIPFPEAREQMAAPPPPRHLGRPAPPSVTDIFLLPFLGMIGWPDPAIMAAARTQGADVDVNRANEAIEAQANADAEAIRQASMPPGIFNMGRVGVHERAVEAIARQARRRQMPSSSSSSPTLQRAWKKPRE